MYRYDASYANSVYEKYPNKFRLVKPVDPNNPEVGEIIQEWAKNKGAVAIRLMLAYEEQRFERSRPRCGNEDGLKV